MNIDLEKEDNEYILNSGIDFNRFSGKTVLVTGATGLIGGSIIRTFIYAKKSYKIDVTVIALVRNIDKAKRVFSSDIAYIETIEGNITDKLICDLPIDYIIHSASQTSSKAFVDYPVETINVAIEGTKRVLELAREKKIEKLVYLSTMEVYGTPDDDTKINEKRGTDLDTMAIRSCYPESKRMCENMCACYSLEFSIPISVVRLTQTIGPGVDYYDGRVFAEFARCAIEGRDIVLRTAGRTKRSYLYTADAVLAILTVLLNGKNREIYNAANESSYCTIIAMANVVKKCSKKTQIEVKIEIDSNNDCGFAPELRMNLDTSKLRELGWTPYFSLEDMYCRLMLYFDCISKET